jgi:ketosteroid isomerase-like protein
MHKGDYKMTTPTAIVRSFYEKLESGDAPGALGLMAQDIEWITMWHYKVEGRGPERVAEGLFKPLMAEWTTFALVPTEFIEEGDTVVTLGHFSGVHGTTGKQAEARYAHVWTIKDERIARFRQYIDTCAIAEARRP